MSNHTPLAPVADPIAAPVEVAGSYCCECGTFGAHEIRCLCCGFDFRDMGANVDEAAE